MSVPKAVKIAAIICGVILALVIVMAVLVKILVSPEMVKRTVLPKISARIERTVTIGDVEVSIFRGIRLRDLEVREKDNSGPFLKAGAIRLSYRFWPLLAGRVEVDEALLEDPQVRVVRFPDGSFNFSDLKKKEPVKEEQKEKGPLRLDIKTAGVSGGRVTYEDRGAAGGRGYTLEVTGIGLSASDISLEGEFPLKAEAAIPGVTVSLAGTVAKAGTAPQLAGELTVVAKELSAAVKGLPPAFGEKLAKLALTGGVEARLKLGGEVKQPKGLLRGGEIRLSGLSMNAGGQRPTLTGALTLGSDSLESMGLTLALGEQKLGINLTAKNLFSRPVQIGLGIDGDRLDLDRLLPPKKGGGAQAPTPAQPAAEPGPVQLPLEGGGAVRIGTLVCRGLSLEGVNLAWRLKDNVVTIESLKGKGAGGSFSASGRLDLRTRGFAYGASLDLQGVQADRLVTAFTPRAAGSLTGTLALKADIGGRGTAALKRNLVGKGTFNVADGRLSGEGFMPTLAAFLGAEELRVLRFSSLAGDFALRDGVVTLNGKGDGSDAKLLAAGRIGLDKTMDMGIELKLSPALTARVARGSAGKYVADRDGWGSVPLRATGQVAKPTFALDSAKVGSRVVESLKQRINEKLLKRDAGTGGTQSPGRRGVEETLRGILGN